jgi:anti-sigma factor RsiW
MMNSNPPVTESELHALVDGQLTVERARDVEAWLAGRPEESLRVADYRAQKLALRTLFDSVLVGPVPHRLDRAAQARQRWHLQRIAAGIAIALFSGAAGWGLRVQLSPSQPSAPSLVRQDSMPYGDSFARRAAVAHAVYSPELRRPVEVDAAHEDQLVAWLSKRLGVPMKPPHLQTLGYALEGGRLLPGGQGPVAQFMYRDDFGGRLTLYVSHEGGSSAAEASKADAAFRFAREGAINVFYWVDGPLGYALSAQTDRAALARVSFEVYRQLAAH